MSFQEILSGLFLCLGAFFVVVASIGIIRFPDFFTRLHAAGKCDTLGLGFVLIGLAIYEASPLTSLKLLLIAIFIGVANPTATHALARAAYKIGIKPLLGSLKNQKKETDADSN